MANGQQLAEEYVQRFATWVASKTDDDFRNMVMRGVLSRTEIAAECGFAKSALAQNPRIRKALKDLEDSLRERHVLPPVVEPVESGTEVPGQARRAEPVRAAQDAERLSRLEQENASLRAENAELKQLLARYSVLHEVLAETGRLPR
ncbi:VPA1267 family protein [Paraburkholderia oxyphila]|uniref:VPA1267 family protein n=1 Tax=Paraburkholderia oxyphila TaxID=614212 RepID=UPI00048707DC|nr:VPA1267 family protein [Paraburkholderia oxyphila]